jgi:hypothetical protein
MLRLKSRQSAESRVTLLDAVDDPHLFGPWFRDPRSWRAWRVVIKALFGLPMMRAELDIYRKLTGRTTPPTRKAREAWLVKGRRAGGSYIAALIGVYLACFIDYRRYLAPGERGVVMILATDRRQARVIMRYVSALLEGVPMLKRMVERMGLESIDLTNSITIEIHTASYRSVRGYTVVAAICDEIAYWRSEESANPDREILDALRPAMSTIPNALLLCLSSPYARRGAIWDAYEQHFGHDGDPVIVFQGDTLTLNPTVPQSVIDDAYRADPAAAAAEYGAQFRSDIEGFLQPEWISNAVADGIHEVGPASGIGYVAFTDPSGGSKDAFTLAIAHNDGGRLILDAARSHRPPFDPKAVVAEFALLLKRYGLGRVTGDRYAGEWVVSAFREHGIYYEQSGRSKSEIYLEIVPQFATGAVQLLDNRNLLNELRQLERRTGQTKDVVDHPPRGHDDLANSACGALLLAVRSGTVDLSQAFFVSPEELRRGRDEHLARLGFAGGASDDDNESPFLKGNFNDYEI